MPALIDTPLMAAPAHLDRPAVIGEARNWTWREVHAQSLALAERLEPGSVVFNLCSSRLGFLIAWLALSRRGCLQLLPPSGGSADLLSLLKGSAQPAIVVDDAKLLQPQWAEHARCLVHGFDSATAQPADAALAWSPDWDAPLIRLYTSGSTGAPQPQLKTLAQLARGATVLGAALERETPGGLAALRRIVCSVPPQHMFGVEASVMLSLVAGIPALDSRPLLPADVRAAFDQCPQGAAWITTPLHIRALVQSGQALPHCRLVLASTMPLAPSLAAQAEALVRAPVVEIYGSTETGALASRRAARGTEWQALDGVRLEPQGQQTKVWGAHFPSPQLLPDQVEVGLAAGGFRLQGRHSDLLKIGGRRASLAGLNLLLQDMPGLADGVFFLPATGAPTERLVMVQAGATPDRATALRWLRERMDPVFLPRTVIQLERLPRTDSGKLPHAALEQVYAAWLAKRRPASRFEFGFEFQVPADHPSLPGHFPGRPIVPGVLLLDRVLEALQRRTGRASARVSQVKFVSALRPDETAQAVCRIDGQRVSFRVTALRGGAIDPIAQGLAELAANAQEGSPA